MKQVTLSSTLAGALSREHFRNDYYARRALGKRWFSKSPLRLIGSVTCSVGSANTGEEKSDWLGLRLGASRKARATDEEHHPYQTTANRP